jgi:hypothetical protein
MICPYCGNKAVWVENKEVYGKNYGESYMIWLCKPCDAYVGCHCNTETPLGTMANKELRALRHKVHLLIDPYWQKGKYKRKEVYKKLDELFGKEFHVGGSTKEECLKIISLFQNSKK